MSFLIRYLEEPHQQAIIHGLHSCMGRDHSFISSKTGTKDRTISFMVCVLDDIIYVVLKERNGRRFGETPNSASVLIRIIDKQVQKRITSMNH